MRGFLIFLCIVFVVFGCGKKPQPAEVTGKESETVLPEQGVAVEKATEEVSPAQEAPEISAEQQAAQQSIMPETEKKPVMPVEPAPTLGAERLLKENRWGFSVYDPNTGVVKYYTSKGDYIGSAKR